MLFRLKLLILAIAAAGARILRVAVLVRPFAGRARLRPPWIFRYARAARCAARRASSVDAGRAAAGVEVHAARAHQRRERLGQGRQLPGRRGNHAVPPDPQDHARRIRPGGNSCFPKAGPYARCAKRSSAHQDLKHDTANLEAAEIMERLGEPGAFAEGLFFPGYLRLRQGLERARGAGARAPARCKEPARCRLGRSAMRACRSPIEYEALHPRLDRREGNRRSRAIAAMVAGYSPTGCAER